MLCKFYSAVIANEVKQSRKIAWIASGYRPRNDVQKIKKVAQIS